MVSDGSCECEDIEVKEVIGSVDLEIGSIFKSKSDKDGLSYVYIGCHNLYGLSEIDNTIFTTFIQECENMVHLFYCRERNEYTKFKWVNAELLENKLSGKELDDILNNFYYSPIGTRIKEAEFHINHLNFNSMDFPVNFSSSKIALFSRSFFKELNKEDKLFLVIEWDKSTVSPNYLKFTPHIIRIIDDKEKFTFDYLPREHWEKFNGFLNLESVHQSIKSIEAIAKKRPGIMCYLSKSLKDKFNQEKIKEFQKLKLGSLYLIYEKVKK